jgi:hypothetical protein
VWQFDARPSRNVRVKSFENIFYRFTGCAVEKRQLESASSLLTLVFFCMKYKATGFEAAGRRQEAGGRNSLYLMRESCIYRQSQLCRLQCWNAPAMLQRQVDQNCYNHLETLNRRSHSRRPRPEYVRYHKPGQLHLPRLSGC